MQQAISQLQIPRAAMRDQVYGIDTLLACQRRRHLLHTVSIGLQQDDLITGVLAGLPDILQQVLVVVDRSVDKDEFPAVYTASCRRQLRQWLRRKAGKLQLALNRLVKLAGQNALVEYLVVRLQAGPIKTIQHSCTSQWVSRQQQPGFQGFE